MTYVYLGDRWTRPELRGALCNPVRRRNGRCIRGRGSMLVRFATGELEVVHARRLRILRDVDDPQPPLVVHRAPWQVPLPLAA